MALEQHFVCPLANGIHARPASALEEVVRGFNSEITLVNQRTHCVANGKSILAIVGADIRHADPCVFKISGPDEHEAMAALTVFLQDKFPSCDEPLAAPSKRNGELPLPPCLANAGATFFRGMPVVPGIAQGVVVSVGNFSVPASLPRNGVVDTEAEWRQLDAALEKLQVAYERQFGATNGVEAALVKVHRSIARDVEFRQWLHAAVAGRRLTAAGAIEAAGLHFSNLLVATGSAILCDRALDIQDVCFQLLKQVCGGAISESSIGLTADSIVIAESLTPGQFLALDRKFLKGLVLASASATSHTVILARSFNLPTLAGVENLAAIKLSAQKVVVDAEVGALVTNLTEPAQRYYALEERRLAGRLARLKKLSASAAVTQDGHRIEIVANIATAGEVATAFDSGAEGIGLFRTEMLFLDRKSAPTEAEQFEEYRAALSAANGQPVVIRTLDIGGDKKLDYLNLPAEENPFLGCRAVRIYPEFESLFRTQIRALVRASAFGKLRVMIPMISTVDEARWVKHVVAEEKKNARRKK